MIIRDDRVRDERLGVYGVEILRGQVVTVTCGAEGSVWLTLDTGYSVLLEGHEIQLIQDAAEPKAEGGSLGDSEQGRR